MNYKKKFKNRNRQGAIIVLFAVLLPILLVILGFAVDYAYMQKTRNEARVIADLGAKAAADTLARTGGDVDAAIASARLVASSNRVAGSTLNLSTDQIVFGRAYKSSSGKFIINDGQTPFNSVTVSAERTAHSVDGPSKLFFGQLYGTPTFETIQQASSSFRDVEIILVLDRSGSMKYDIDGEPTEEEKQRRACRLPRSSSRWMALDNAVAAFLRELDASQVQEKIGLATFASDLTMSCNNQDVTISQSSLDSRLSRDLNRIRREMDDFKNEIWFGGTNIRAGINEARLHFASNGSANVDKIIVCLTDGVHNVGGDPIEEARRCESADITIHTITFSESADEDRMRAIAEQTGGSHSHAPDSETLERIFKRLAGSFAILTE